MLPEGVTTIRGTVMVDKDGGVALTPQWMSRDLAVPDNVAVTNGVVYAGSRDGSIYAFSAASGAQLWSVATGGPVAALASFLTAL